MEPREKVDILRSAVQICREKDVTLLSASIAFYAFFSVIPVVILALAIGSFLGGEEFGERIVSFTELYLSIEGEQVLSEALADSTGRIGASTLGLLALIWSALKVFRAVDVAFDIIYGSEESTSFVRRVVNGVVVMAVIVVGLGLLVGVRIFVTRSGVGDLPYFRPFSRLVSLGGLVAILVPIYYVMPPVSVSFRATVPGIVTTVVGWILLQTVFQVYAENAFQYHAYGLVGVVLLFLLWLYIGATVLLFGAAVNAVEGDRNR